MRVLHTSDWHIGRVLYGKKRYREFELFLDWLIDIVKQKNIDVLLIAGDVFDTCTPGTISQELYYRFLSRIAYSGCSHVVVTAGNHDSASFLNASSLLLRNLNVYVISQISGSLNDEILILKSKENIPELIVCAVPYLRDRDIRTADAGESIEDKERKMLEGIRSHYAQVCNLAEKKRKELNFHIPLVVMGHLFTAGAKTEDGDGVRELYVGSLAHITADIFPDFIDYIALGHLHIPQTVNRSEKMRYSGSPIPMGFGEANQSKSVSIIEFCGTNTNVSLLEVPVFQHLKSIEGDWNQIYSTITELSRCHSDAWLEISYKGQEIISDLRERLEQLVSGTKMEILRIKNNRIVEKILNASQMEETLDDLSVYEVFQKCLDSHDITAEQRMMLADAYREIVTSVFEDENGPENKKISKIEENILKNPENAYT